MAQGRQLAQCAGGLRSFACFVSMRVCLMVSFSRSSLSLAMACLLLAALPSLVPPAAAQASRPGVSGTRLPQPPRPVNETEGRQIIERFRSHRLTGDFYFEFELVQLPRRGDPVPFAGMMWGTWTDAGPMTRVALWEPGKREATLSQFLILSGSNPRAWAVRGDGKAEELSGVQLFEPLLEQLLYTPFDLAMPFVYWDAQYLGPERVRGRRAQIFLMSAPEAVRTAQPQWDRVQVALDNEYDALLRAEVVDEGGTPLRSFRIVSFKEVGGQYIVKGIDLVDEIGRDKTRFEVLRAAVGLRLPPTVFAPESLSGNRLPQLAPIPLENL